MNFDSSLLAYVNLLVNLNYSLCNDEPNDEPKLCGPLTINEVQQYLDVFVQTCQNMILLSVTVVPFEERDFFGG